jgi:hypothetical protein
MKKIDNLIFSEKMALVCEHTLSLRYFLNFMKLNQFRNIISKLNVMQKISQIDQSVRMLWFVEFEKRRKLVACVHNLNLN